MCTSFASSVSSIQNLNAIRCVCLVNFKTQFYPNFCVVFFLVEKTSDFFISMIQFSRLPLSSTVHFWQDDWEVSATNNIAATTEASQSVSLARSRCAAPFECCSASYLWPVRSALHPKQCWMKMLMLSAFGYDVFVLITSFLWGVQNIIQNIVRASACLMTLITVPGQTKRPQNRFICQAELQREINLNEVIMKYLIYATDGGRASNSFRVWFTLD